MSRHARDSGAGTVNLGGIVETGRAVNVGTLNVVDGGIVTNLANIHTTGASHSWGRASHPAQLERRHRFRWTDYGEHGDDLSLGADDVLGNFVGGVSSLIVNGGNVTAVAGRILLCRQ